jgi:hypothetical protein
LGEETVSEELETRDAPRIGLSFAASFLQPSTQEAEKMSPSWGHPSVTEEPERYVGDRAVGPRAGERKHRTREGETSDSEQVRSERRRGWRMGPARQW